MVDENAIRELCERIAREFQPEKIILFGSYAYGQPQPDSDVDLLVLLPFEGKGFRKSVEILNRVSPAFSVDLLARHLSPLTGLGGVGAAGAQGLRPGLSSVARDAGFLAGAPLRSPPAR